MPKPSTLQHITLSSSTRVTFNDTFAVCNTRPIWTTTPVLYPGGPHTAQFNPSRGKGHIFVWTRRVSQADQVTFLSYIYGYALEAGNSNNLSK